MQAYKFETTLTQHGTLTLNNLPLKAGQFVEVIILTRPALPPSSKRYTLRGLLSPTLTHLSLLNLKLLFMRSL